jgi:hypothetical protein
LRAVLRGVISVFPKEPLILVHTTLALEHPALYIFNTELRGQKSGRRGRGD